MRNDYPQFISAILVCVGAFFLINPTDIWMPDMAHMTVLGITVAAFGALSLFVIHESSIDERDDAHRSFSGRVAFLAGSFVLVIAIAAQTLSHSLDGWLVVALVAMVLAKLGARVWSDRYR
jgi:hypothetical protein